MGSRTNVGHVKEGLGNASPILNDNKLDSQQQHHGTHLTLTATTINNNMHTNL
jgi:hypothetical protein